MLGCRVQELFDAGGDVLAVGLSLDDIEVLLDPGQQLLAGLLLGHLFQISCPLDNRNNCPLCGDTFQGWKVICTTKRWDSVN